MEWAAWWHPRHVTTMLGASSHNPHNPHNRESSNSVTLTVRRRAISHVSLMVKGGWRMAG